jgi:alpha,alpha-trehalase
VSDDGTVTAAPRVEAYASNFVPLWAGLAEAGSPEALAAVEAFKASVRRRAALSSARVEVAVQDPLPLHPRVHDDEQGVAASQGLLGPAGIAASMRSTGQQWDHPNAWPPLQDMIIEAFERTGGPQRDTDGCLTFAH